MHKLRVPIKLCQDFSSHCWSPLIPGPAYLVSGLPLSEGNSIILTVVDKVSKMVHFFPLSKLPSKDTAELMLNQVFKLHGFPMDVVLDRGPQFISQFWTAFCTLLRASESLSSGQTEKLNQEIEKGLCLLLREGGGRRQGNSLFGWNTLLGLSPAAMFTVTSHLCSRP